MALIAAAAICLSQGSVWAQEPQTDSDAKAGELRVEGVAPSDRVYIDGELVGSGRKLARFKNTLPIAAGEYVVSVRDGNDQVKCARVVQVPGNGSAVARCGAGENPLEARSRK
jgi:hypothetical protein